MPLNKSILMLSAAIIFLVLFLFSIGITRLIRQRAERKKMIHKIKTGGHGDHVADAGNLDDGQGRSQSLTLALFKKIGSRVAPDSGAEYSTMRMKMLRAGLSSENAAAMYWGAKIFFVFTLPAVFVAIRLPVLKLIETHYLLGIGVVLAIVGLYLPDLWLHIRTDRRKQAILKSLPDALDMMVVCVESGMALDSAFNRVAREMEFSDPGLSRELLFMNRELRAGMARRDALRHLAQRTNLDEINNFVTLLIQADKFGTSIAQALRIYSDSFRKERFQRAEEKAAKIPVKILIPLILFIFPALFIVILGPAMMSIFKALSGMQH